jgi:hypothetical protein
MRRQPTVALQSNIAAALASCWLVACDPRPESDTVEVNATRIDAGVLAMAKDSGLASPASDSGRQPSAADSGSLMAATCATGCPQSAVCCPSTMPCAGQCVPDCRVVGQSCPSMVPICDEETGLCDRSGDGGIPLPPRDGGLPPFPPDGGPLGPPSCEAGCPANAVCCPSPLPCAGQCVLDCRVEASACPLPAPICDETTGLCHP